MQLMLRVGVVVGVLTAIAAAQPSPSPLTESDFEPVEPNRGIEKVTLPDRVPWCTAPFSGERWDGRRIVGAVLTRSRGDDFAPGLMQLCQAPTARANRLVVQYMLQRVMNDNGIAQDKAEAFVAKKLGMSSLQQVRHAAPSDSDEARSNFGESDYSVVAPNDGTQTAVVNGPPSWCAGVGSNEHYEPGGIGRTLRAGGGLGSTVKAAALICARPNNATWQKEAGYILQQWMNYGNFSQAEAEASLKARVQTAKFEADRVALCKRLEVSAEAGGEVLAFAEGHQVFFGCTSKQEPLWVDPLQAKGEVGFYLDAAPRPQTEMLRMYYLLHDVRRPWKQEEQLPSRNAEENALLLNYAVAEHDFTALDLKEIDKQLAAAPFSNSEYARIIAHETYGILKAEQVAYEAAIDKLAKNDKDYTHILREIPNNAAAAWEKLTGKWRPELDRSYAFERKLSEPSRSALKGCSTELTKDAEKLIRSYNDRTYLGLMDKAASDPIANLLLSRLAICDGIDGAYGISGALADLVKHGREIRGPRGAAYYDLIEALAAAHKDRPKLLLPKSFRIYQAGEVPPSLFSMYSDVLTGAAPRDPEAYIEHGIVKSATKVGDGVKIVFRTDRISFAHYDCSDDTNRPLRINQNTGAVEYHRNCTATGKMDSQDNTPSPITVSEASATLVKPGTVVVCGEVQHLSKPGDERGFVIYAKKAASDPKIETFFGFAL